MAPALAGRLLITAPPGKSLALLIFEIIPLVKVSHVTKPRVGVGRD